MTIRLDSKLDEVIKSLAELRAAIEALTVEIKNGMANGKSGK